MLQVLALTDVDQAIYTQYHKDCVDSSGVKIELLESAYEGEVVEDVNFKTYLHCYFLKAGFQNEHGEMQSSIINSVLPYMTADEDEMARIILECERRKLKGNDPTETAFLNFKCYIGAI